MGLVAFGVEDDVVERFVGGLEVLVEAVADCGGQVCGDGGGAHGVPPLGWEAPRRWLLACRPTRNWLVAWPVCREFVALGATTPGG